MNIGDIVRHKNMDDRLRIRTLKDGICTLEFIERPKMFYMGSDTEDYERCIAKVENLLPDVEPTDENQLNLFA